MPITADQLRKADEEELEQMLEDAKEEFFNLRFQLASGQLEDSSRIRIVRRDIARIKTIARQRELAAELLQEAEND
jgi:large subunit ribosomal protein L29